VKFLEQKAGPMHYVTTALVVMGLWYVIGKMSHGNVSSPASNATVDVTSMVVLSG